MYCQSPLYRAVQPAALALAMMVAPAVVAQQRFSLAASGQPSGQVFNPVFSPDSDRLAALHALLPAGNEPAAEQRDRYRVSIWDVATRQRVQWLDCRQPGGSHFVPRLAFSPDGKWLALAEYDGRLRLWNTGNWTATTVTIPMPADEAVAADVAAPARSECMAVAFAPDSRQLAALYTVHAKDDSHHASLHDLQTGKTTATLALDGHPAAVAWQPDDRLALVMNIAPARRKLHVELQEWNVRGTGSDETLPALARRQNVGERPVIAAFAPGAQTLAYAAGSQIALCNVRSGEVRQLGTFGDYYGSRVPNYRAGATALAYSADGATLAAGGNALMTHTRLRFFALRGQTFDFDPDAFDHGAGYAVTNIVLAPSGEYLATAVHRWAESGESLFLWEMSSKID